jgi:hypothetical protein
MRLVVVPSTLALLPEYASVEDPIGDLRAAVLAAVGWLVEHEPADLLAASGAAHRVGVHLLGSRLSSTTARPTSADGTGLLVVANGSAKRTEKAPGHFDDRAEGFDDAIGKALADGDPAALRSIDEELARELWSWPDAGVFSRLDGRVPAADSVQVDYDDAPYGVQYWVVRWQCGS